MWKFGASYLTVPRNYSFLRYKEPSEQARWTRQPSLVNRTSGRFKVFKMWALPTVGAERGKNDVGSSRSYSSPICNPTSLFPQKIICTVFFSPQKHHLLYSHTSLATQNISIGIELDSIIVEERYITHSYYFFDDEGKGYTNYKSRAICRQRKLISFSYTVYL